MLAPIYLKIRNGFSALTQKLIPEALVSGLAIALIIALFASVMRVNPPSSRLERQGAGAQVTAASDEATADFMERVALSHVGATKPPPAAPSADIATEPPAAAAPLPPQSASAPGHDRPHAAIVRVAATTPAVLPPPRPQQVTIEPAIVVAEPAKNKPLRPLRNGLHFFTQIVDIVPASGARVYEGMSSIGGALASFAKKL